MRIKAEPYTHDPLYSDRTYIPEEKREYEKMYEATTGGNFVDDVEQLIRKNYKECPYCHKPIQEFIMGYPVRDLLVLLESLRLNGIPPENVKLHTLNIEFAYQSVMKALEEQMSKMFEGRAE